MRPLLLSLLLVSSALAQAPPYGVAEGDHVRLRLSLPSLTPAAVVEGRLTVTGADSLTLVPALGGRSAGRRIAWQDVERVERRGENRVGEVVGMAVGLAVGMVVGGVIGAGVKPNALEGPLGGGLLGGFAGMAAGAATGARTRRPWVELPRGGGAEAPVSFRIALPLR